MAREEMMDMMGNDRMGGGMLLFGLFWLIFSLVLLTVGVLTIAALIRYLRSSDQAVNILRERYAKGEIKEEEFRRMKQEIYSQK